MRHQIFFVRIIIHVPFHSSHVAIDISFIDSALNEDNEWHT